MRLFLWSLILGLLGALLAGCARFPTGDQVTNAPPRTLYSEITLNGPINPNYYYFLALGVDQTRSTGPVPVVTGPELSNGWGTITGLPSNQVQIPPFFVQFHNNTFAQFRRQAEQTEYLGAPYRYGTTTVDGRGRIWVEIDQRLLEPFLGTTANPIVQLNWITMQVITVPPEQIGLGKQYDGFGVTGNGYLDAVPLTTAITWESGINGQPVEPPYGPDERTAQDPSIDMIDWRVDVRIRTTPTTTP